jgi:dephospho-CoA kinase
MYVLGVTGGIGSGKSTAARLFGECGAGVIDLDELAKRLIAPGAPLAGEVAAAFGEAVLTSGGAIDTKALAKAAFATPEAAKRLDAIVHPGVFAAIVGALDTLAEAPEAPAVVVLDIPLLVEAPMFFDVIDGVLVVSAHEDARLARLVARGMTEEEAHARMALQVSDAERRDIADFTVENDASLDEFRELLYDFWEAEMADRGA